MQTWLSTPYSNDAPKVSRLLTAALFALMLCGSAAVARAADFGSPPSGEVPILYNDHTVYAKPDILKQSRVLAALLKDGQIYVPLRDMFEQMGATVTASADGKTITAVKDGASVSVTLGQDVVVINGESRPLDVPPMLYHGVLLVPVRVISEALGAYVQWVPDKRVVVIRYIPATPMPTATPSPEPTIAPTPTPVPIIAPTPSYNGFVQAAFWAPKSYNEFTAGGYCRSYLASAVYAPQNSKFAAKVDFRQYAYLTSTNITDAYGNQYTRFATIDGGTAVTPVFLGRQNSIDGRLEYQVASPRVYVGIGYIRTSNNYGYPQLSGVGFGIEKLPDLRPGLSVYGSAFYYPSASGNYTVTSPTSSNYGTSYRQQYRITKYDVGLALVLKHSPVYLYGGFAADQYAVKENAPIGQTHNGPYIGLGVKL
ncbi:MAG: copper amine oxidase N-terminal domain-containing protein [Vulcanimicrobiaceae bacterium]